jgi:hypothetical protein
MGAQVNIPVPQRLIDLWTRFGDVFNAWIWKHDRFEVRRIDILLVILLMFTVASCWAAYGWSGALQGGVFFIVMSALALLIRRV